MFTVAVVVLSVCAVGVLLVLLVATLVGRGEALPPATVAEVRSQFESLESAAQLRQVRFPLDVRGYRMRDVDAAMEAAAQRIEALEAQLAGASRAEAAPAAEQ